MLIKVRNLLDQTAPVTYLTQLEGNGTTTIHVKNSSQFTESWAVQIGKTGEERSEIKLGGVAIPSGTSLTVVSTGFDHPTDTPTYCIKYDQVVWKRSVTGTGGTAVAFATSSITPDSLYTEYDDTSGASTYAYKAAWYNSGLGTLSTESDWITTEGYSFYSLAKMRERVKNKLLNSGFIGNDNVIDDWINEYLEILTNTAIDVNSDYNMGSTSIAYSIGQEMGTITATDFKQLRRVWFASSGGTYAMTKMEVTSPLPNQIFNETNPMFFMYGDKIVSRWPYDSSAGTMQILYYKLNPVMTNETDEIPNSMKGYTKGFVDYCLSQAYNKDNKFDQGAKKEADAYAVVDKFKSELVVRNKTGSTYINIVENFSDDVDFGFRI